MSLTPRLNREFFWECPARRRFYRQPDAAAQCPCPGEANRAVVAPLVRSADLPLFDDHPLALTGWLEAEQAELTVLHRKEDGTVTATAYRFCASRDGLEPTGALALVPARGCSTRNLRLTFFGIGPEATALGGCVCRV